MTEHISKKEFNEFLDAFNKEPGTYTKEELYQIGLKYKQLPTSEKRWTDLVNILEPKDEEGHLLTGEQFRLWIKNKQLNDGTLTKNITLLSGRTIEHISFKEFADKTEQIKSDLYKQQVKTRDVYNAYRSSLRTEARLDNFIETLCDTIKTLPSLPVVNYDGNTNNNDVEAVLLISDWHLGAKIDNPFNSYNLDIARKRIAKLRETTIRYCQEHKVKCLHVVNLNDLIAGNIHISGRLEQETDVIKQVVIASEELSKLLSELQKAAPSIVYHSCTDNHSRVTPNLKEHIEPETFVKLIDYYVEGRLVNTSIQFDHSNLDPATGIIQFENGKIGVFEHGHQGSLNSFFQDMVCYSGRNIDYGFVGHYHNEKLKTLHTFKLFVNGSLVGTDAYALSKRLFSKPSQSLIIFDEDNIINCSINLDVKDKKVG